MLISRALLYPLGFLANLLFSYRVLDQWISSEKKKESSVSTRFWKISYLANLLMVLHALIQLHYPLCLIQFFNSVIAWRNLDLMHTHPRPRSRIFLILAGGIFFITALFWLQAGFQISDWIRAPSLPWSQKAVSVGWFLHSLGFIGMALFASRFWIQWWVAERNKKSMLSPLFWWISLSGSTLCIFYFWKLNDLVNLISYSTGLIPYLRNLMLGKKKPLIEPKRNDIYLFAGEQSGDLLGSGLLEALKRLRPSWHYKGVGGEKMRSQGLSCQIQTEQFQVMGISAVLKAFPRIVRLFYRIRRQILTDQPAAVVLIDYPDFTMRLEKSLRKKGYQGKLIHYVSPSVWAWRASRVKALSKHLDLLMTILPFEKACYAHTKLPVHFVGHPLVSLIENHLYADDWQATYSIDPSKPLITLFPGSRSHELEANLEIQLKAASIFLKNHPQFQVAISIARPDLNPLVDQLTQNVPFPLLKIPGHLRYELMKASTCALATSGTVTLELALHKVPSVVTYRLGKMNYLMGRYVFNIRLSHFCIVNLIAKKTVFPEFVDLKISPFSLAHTLDQQYADSHRVKSECHQLYLQLKDGDANKQAAKTLLTLLESPS